MNRTDDLCIKKITASLLASYGTGTVPAASVVIVRVMSRTSVEVSSLMVGYTLHKGIEVKLNRLSLDLRCRFVSNRVLDRPAAPSHLA